MFVYLTPPPKFCLVISLIYKTVCINGNFKKNIYISTKPKILSLFLKDYYLILLLFILFHLVSDISDKLFEIIYCYLLC